MTKKTNSKAGTPRWIPVSGAIVAIIALAWTIVSFFLPKPDPSTAPPTATNGAQANGPGSVAIQTMNDGTVNVGVPPRQSEQQSQTQSTPKP